MVSGKIAGFLFALCDLCGNIIFVSLGGFVSLPAWMVTPGFLPSRDTCTSLYIVGKGREQERKLCPWMDGMPQGAMDGGAAYASDGYTQRRSKPQCYR